MCALTIEADAVLAIFDETWDMAIYGKAQSDTNAYNVGRIGDHNVVLAHLPGPGRMSAATGALQFSQCSALLGCRHLWGGAYASGDGERNYTW